MDYTLIKEDGGIFSLFYRANQFVIAAVSACFREAQAEELYVYGFGMRAVKVEV